MSTIVNPDAAMMCPICLDTMSIPIIQCKRGHSMCGNCINDSGIDICPCCRGPLSQMRNFQLEQLIEGVKNVFKVSCCYGKKGCKFVLSQGEKEEHEEQCKYRRFKCEGQKFAKWKCDWSGEFSEIHKHFLDHHNQKTWMQYCTAANMKMCLDKDYYDVQIISFFNGQNLFYYKHKVDVAKAKVYWVFQLIGLKSQAAHYFYEFEVHNGPVRKLKMTEFCESDTANLNEIFEKEKCVVMSFQTVKNYLNDEGELPFKFRIMSQKKSSAKS